MNVGCLYYLAPIACSFALTNLASAQTATANFGVTITIEDACIIVSASDLDFGTVGTLTSPVTAESSIVVNCTTGAAYDLALNEGANGATTSDRAMADGAGSISYQLFQEEARTSAWGEDTSAVTSTGTGNDQAYTVFGEVPVQTTPPAGTYTDTVGVTIIF